MKKFLSKVLTLALVCAIVVTGTSITSEAKGSKSSKKATTTYSSNAVINDFVATGLKSNGLTIGGKSYDSQQALTLCYEANPAVTTSPLCYQENGNIGRYCGFYLFADGSKGVVDSNSQLIYDSDTSTNEINEANAYGPLFYDCAIFNTNGIWNTDVFITNGINAQHICSWMQSRGFNTSSDIYNYLVANGATFTDASSCDNQIELICNQCPELSYCIETKDGTSWITYSNLNLSSGVNGFSIESWTDRDNGNIVTDWYGEVYHSF